MSNTFTVDETVAIIRKARLGALRNALNLRDHEDVQAPVGHSAWGEAYQDGWIAGAQAYRDAIQKLIDEASK